MDAARNTSVMERAYILEVSAIRRHSDRASFADSVEPRGKTVPKTSYMHFYELRGPLRGCKTNTVRAARTRGLTIE